MFNRKRSLFFAQTGTCCIIGGLLMDVLPLMEGPAKDSLQAFQVSISSKFYSSFYTHMCKKDSQVSSVFFALLGPTCVKAESKMLMKSTPDLSLYAGKVWRHINLWHGLPLHLRDVPHHHQKHCYWDL
jgi:hypothetical protein